MSQGREVHESTPVSRVMWSWDVARAGVVVPLAADLVSPRGLRGLGPFLRQRREERQRVVLARAPEGLDLPTGRMSPLGHVIMQSGMRLDRPVQAHRRWLARTPIVYDRWWLFNGAICRRSRGGGW